MFNAAVLVLKKDLQRVQHKLMHVYSEVRPVYFKGASSQVSVHRIAAHINSALRVL